VQVNWQPRLAERERGTLSVLAVGVSRYADEKYTLDSADRDAVEMVEAFQRLREPLFRDVQWRCLTNEQATKDEVLKGVHWLRDSARRPNDLAVLTVSGHGRLGDDRDRTYFFLPHDYNPRSELVSGGISWNDFMYYLRGIPCRVLVVMDTCHSGAI